jgi:hypothetical protein
MLISKVRGSGGMGKLHNDELHNLYYHGNGIKNDELARHVE